MPGGALWVSLPEEHYLTDRQKATAAHEVWTDRDANSMITASIVPLPMVDNAAAGSQMIIGETAGAMHAASKGPSFDPIGRPLDSLTDATSTNLCAILMS
jgi:hypothetical protein